MRIRNTETNEIVTLGAIDSNGIDFLQDFFEGGRVFNGKYNDDDNCYDTDTDGFNTAISSFDDYITEDAGNASDDQWIATKKWIEE